MSPTNFTVSERNFIVNSYLETNNYKEVSRTFIQVFGKPLPCTKSIKRIVQKINLHGNTDSKKCPGPPRRTKKLNIQQLKIIEKA